MQLFPIFLIAIVLAADQGILLSETHFGLQPWHSALIAMTPVLVVLGMTWLGVSHCRRRLDRGASPRLILAAERMCRFARLALLVNHAAAVLAFGWLHAVRTVVGDPILLDEIIAIMPPVLGVLGTWAIFYPIERRLRESILVRRLDEGLAIHPIPSRRRYIAVQARMGLLLLLVPILMIVGLAETIRGAAQHLPWDWVPYAVEPATLVAAATVFLFAPVIARTLLHVEPLAPGELRESLLDICRRHRVRVRELLFWNTSGSMINAAVMGLVGRLRYVLITDALLESMNEDEVKAVMAHEVGHVRRHHLPWLIVSLFATLLVTHYLVNGPLILAHALGLPLTAGNGIAQGVFMGSMIAQLIVALWVFGWISRRFERQADTFAVQHLSGMNAPESTGIVDLHAVESMAGALDRIAQLNAVDPDRHSWRHGSIAWRKNYLQSIVGAPLRVLPIDRVVRIIKLSSATILIVAGALAFFL